jgi:hypothetical protein
MDSGQKDCDSPEPGRDRHGKAVVLLVGALVVAGILYMLSTGRVEIFS